MQLKAINFQLNNKLFNFILKIYLKNTTGNDNHYNNL